MELGFDLVHYLRQQHLPKTRYLLPIFEAVVNGFHAIKQAKRPDGRIEILCKRERQQTIKENGQSVADASFATFIVRDNGVGFTETEYDAFCKFSTDRKLALGGKGQGRFTWLMAFGRAEVESAYRENSRIIERNFTFVAEKDPIKLHGPRTSNTDATGTTIRLEGYKSEFRERCPKSIPAIARQLVDHCFALLFERHAPQVTVAESDSLERAIPATRICLNDLLKSEIVLDSSTKSFQLQNNQFKIRHVLRASAEGDHQIHLCANDLPVTSWKLQKVLPIAKGKLEKADGTACTYTSYISSKLLDEAANTLRTRFDLATDDDTELLDEVTEAAIVRKAAELASGYLTDLLEPRRKKQDERFDDLIRREPRYRPLRKFRKTELDSIPPDLTAEKYEQAIFKIAQRYKAELHERGVKLASFISKDEKDYEQFRQQFNKYLAESNEFAFGDLASYVVDRKAVITFLEARLKAEEGDFAKEDAIHRIIFPLRKTSGDVDVEETNLWLIDEGLAFHRYLGSDLEFRLHEPIDSDSRERPDIAVYQEYFDNRYAFSDETRPYRSVTIIELKRPERDEYRDDDNPIEQAYRYIREIESGKARDRTNNRYSLEREPPYYVYIICTLTPRLRSLAQDYGFTATPDGQGYYNFNKDRRAFVRIIDFWKVIDDAKKRNKAFFDKLNIPTD